MTENGHGTFKTPIFFRLWRRLARSKVLKLLRGPTIHSRREPYEVRPSTQAISSAAVLKRLASCVMVFCSCFTCVAQRSLNFSLQQPASISSSSVYQRASGSPRSSPSSQLKVPCTQYCSVDFSTVFRRCFRFILVGSQCLVPRSSSATVNTVASSDCSVAAPFCLKSCQAARWLAQKWMPFLAAPYQQDDHVLPQMSPELAGRLARAALDCGQAS